MSPLNKEQKEGVLRRIDFIRLELEELKECEIVNYKDYAKNIKERKVLERTVENIVNAIIDISKLLLTGENVEMPATYSDAIKKLELLDVLNPEEAKALGNFVKLRNLLAHEYLDLRWAEINNFLKNKGIVEKFIKDVSKLI